MPVITRKKYIYLSKYLREINIYFKELALKIMEAGKSKKLKVNYTSDKKPLNYGGIVRFVSGNEEVATVSNQGKIVAKHAGTCYVYAFLCSGEYVAVKVTVK